MNSLRQRLAGSPALARVFPFVLFAGLTFFQDSFGEPARYWIYFGKTLLGVWALWVVRPLVTEMKCHFSCAALFVGVAVFVIWIALDPFYPHFGKRGVMWNPFAQFTDNSPQAWFFVGIRVLGSAVVVPPLEEILYRSFLYRWIVRKDFQSGPLDEFNPRAFVLTSLIFGFAHYEWLAGILCGAAYQWLVIRKGRLGEAIVAHAVTNLLLGLWVVWRGAWHFW